LCCRPAVSGLRTDAADELSRASVTAATRALSRKEFAERVLEVKTPSSYDLFCIAFAKNRVLLFCSSALPFLLQQTRCDIDTRDENGRYAGQARVAVGLFKELWDKHV